MERGLRLNPWGILRFITVLAAVSAAWFFLRSYFLFLAVIVTVCGPAVSFLLLWSQKDALCAQAVLPGDKVGRNTDFACDIFVHNRAWYTAFTADITYSWSNLFTGYTERTKRRLWVAPGEGSRIRQQMNSRFAGRVDVCIDAFEVCDLFRIFRLCGCRRIDAHTVVWPAFYETDEEDVRSIVDGFPEENELNKSGINFNPDYEIREYIPGDELKTIHWKLSAKKEELMVRERLAAGHDKVNILLPLEEDRNVNDGLMDSLYALGRLMLHKEYPVQLYWPGRAGQLQSCFLAEEGELENLIGEILSDSGIHRPGEAQARMSEEHPGEAYILVQTGVYRGAYIR